MEHSKEEVHAFLTKINDDLHSFIARSIQDDSALGREWSHLFDVAENPRCHQMLGCNNEECPVYNGDDYRCWLQVGTLCGGEVQGDFAKKFGNCSKCQVYHDYHREPVRALYENIDILISHLTGEVGEYRRRSITDRLTGCYNRHFFEEMVGRELDRAARQGLPTSFLMVDLNNFKQINDSLGHLNGDFFLKEAAKLLQANVRYSDVVFRMGGDEFLVLLINASEMESEICRKRIHEAVAYWNDEFAQTKGAELSLSIGRETLPSGERDFMAAVKRADEDMYRHKAKMKSGSEQEVSLVFSK